MGSRKTAARIKHLLSVLQTRYKLELILFAAIAVFLLVKYFLLLYVVFDFDDFLLSYKYINSDSYDWVANGLRIFENDSISFRNPGIVLIVSILDAINAPFLLPLITNALFFVLIVYVYLLCKKVASRGIAVAVTIFLALNYSFNLGANYVLADIPTTTFMAMSFYYLIKKSYGKSLFSLGVSILFQNLGYLLLPIWGLVYVFDKRHEIKRKLKSKNTMYFLKTVLYACLLLAPVLAWNLYKFVKFGDPLYSKVTHLGLLEPNLNSVLYYAFNAVAMFSLLLPIALVYVLIRYKSVLKNRVVCLLLIGFVFNFLFWVVSYEWDDRRFLAYFIPFAYPLMAFFIGKIDFLRIRYKILIAAMVFYPTMLPVTTFIRSNELPIFHNAYLKVDSFSLNTEYDVKKRPEFQNPVMNISPTLYNAAISYDTRETRATHYNHYSKYVELNYDEQSKKLCYDPDSEFRHYILRSILLIRYNTDVDGDYIRTDCTPKIPG